MDKGLTTTQAAELLGYTREHVSRLARWGILRAERFGDAWVIDPEDVERLKTLQGSGRRLPKVPRKTEPGH